MLPSEKAKILFDQMNGFRITHAHRIKCAKIVCDEMAGTSIFKNDSPMNFWVQAKIELDKLAKKKTPKKKKDGKL